MRSSTAIFGVGVLALLVWTLYSFVMTERSAVTLANGTQIMLRKDEIYLPDELRVMKLSEECLVFRESYLRAETVPEMFKRVCEAEG